jgi:hypothetical protein
MPQINIIIRMFRIKDVCSSINYREAEHASLQSLPFPTNKPDLVNTSLFDLKTTAEHASLHSLPFPTNKPDLVNIHRFS